MKHTWKKTTAFIMALALVAGLAPANVGGFLTGGTAIVASAEEIGTGAEPTDPETVEYDGVTYYNVHSQSLDESELIIYKDMLFSKNEELDGYSIADLWVLFAAAADNDYDDFGKLAEYAKNNIDNNTRVEEPYWSDYFKGIAYCVGQIGEWRYKVVFTDFKLTPLLPSDEGKNYVSTVVETETPTGDSVVVKGFENDTSQTQVKSVTSKTIKVASCSHETTKKIGAEISSSVELGSKASLGGIGASSKFTFSLKAAIDRSWTDSEQESTQVEEEEQVELKAPPYTAVIMTDYNTNVTKTTRYNCPIALSYKVSIYTNSPDNEDSKLCSFGSSSKDAREDIKERASAGKELNKKDSDGIEWKSEALVNEITNYAFQKLSTHVPMSTIGATFTQTEDAKSTRYTYSPLYPLYAVKSNVSSVAMQIGDSNELSDIILKGYNSRNAEYQGFSSEFGHWVITDAKGNELSANDAPIKFDNSFGARYTAVKSGTAYLKYVIDETSYTSMQNTNLYATNDSIRSTAAIKVTVTEDTSKPKVTESKSANFVVDSSYGVNLDDYFDVEFVDSTGKDVDYIWEAKETKRKGITFDDNNEVFFTKPGTFHVRVVDPDDNTSYSDWVEITAEVYGDDWVAPEAEQDPVVDADYGTTFEITGSYTGLVGAEPDAIEGELSGQIYESNDTKYYSHGRLQVEILDETGKEIEVARTWEAMETEGITITEDGKVSFTQPGTYHVCVKSGDFYSDWYEIKAAETSEEYSLIYLENPDGSYIGNIIQPWGTAVTPPADPEMKGYIFKGWSPELPDTMPADILDVTAQWEIDPSVERVLIQGNTRGQGNIEASTDGSEPVFDEEYPMTSLYYNTIKGDPVIFSAKAAEGWVFREWQYKATGEVYSKDATITITADTPLDLVAVFDTEDAAAHKLTDAELIQWTVKDYENKTGTAANAAITGWSDDEYSITLTDDEDNVLDTYTVNPDTGIGTNEAGEEVDLPQTGMSGAHKVLAGLAALMGIAGLGLVKKSRKKDED